MKCLTVLLIPRKFDLVCKEYLAAEWSIKALQTEVQRK